MLPKETPMAGHVTHLECSETGERHAADRLQNLSRAGKALLVRYDLGAVAQAVTKEALAARPYDMWRYRELLPLDGDADIVSLGEAVTPLIPLDRLAPAEAAVLVKDESRLPTASFKARGLALAVTKAKAFGVTRIAMPSNGNAGAALAAYGARAGMEVFVFCPEETPDINVHETARYGAKVWRVNGQIDDCGRIVAEGKAAAGWFDVSTLKEPYRIEGKKTMGLELAEQLGWTLPDVIFYPTGGGTGLIGMWKGFEELRAMGWVGDKLPRMVAVQSTGCAPVVRALDTGAERCEPWPGPKTVVNGVRVPIAFADALILRTVRASQGFGVAVSDEDVIAARDRVAEREGLLLSPEGAATYAAWAAALADGRVAPTDRAVLFNCGSAHKYPMPEVTDRIDLGAPLDAAALVGAAL
ncbi:MAG: threonine synthase [Hyphomicrobiales bacterium]|nr:threonine synthase [Hyphomicrobiales bacterium]